MTSRNKSRSIRGVAGLYRRKEDRIGPDGILARHNFLSASILLCDARNSLRQSGRLTIGKSSWNSLEFSRR
jgi:hypothetical protein